MYVPGAIPGKRAGVGRLLDASALDPPVVSLPLIRYTIHPWGQLADAWPEDLHRALYAEEVVIGWEVWCESVEMSRWPRDSSSRG